MSHRVCVRGGGGANSFFFASPQSCPPEIVGKKIENGFVPLPVSKNRLTMDSYQTHKANRPQTRFELTQPSSELIKLIKSETIHPQKMGRTVKRKVVEYNCKGSAYYWKDNYKGKPPPCLIAYLVENDIKWDENTSILINHYVNNSAIGKHCDSTKGLQLDSLVHSISFSSYKGFKFSTNEEIGRIGFTDYGNIPIMNRSVMSWNPHYHHAHQIQHWTSALKKYYMFERINITVRQLV